MRSTEDTRHPTPTPAAALPATAAESPGILRLTGDNYSPPIFASRESFGPFDGSETAWELRTLRGGVLLIRPVDKRPTCSKSLNNLPSYQSSFPITNRLHRLIINSQHDALAFSGAWRCWLQVVSLSRELAPTSECGSLNSVCIVHVARSRGSLVLRYKRQTSLWLRIGPPIRHVAATFPKTKQKDPSITVLSLLSEKGKCRKKISSILAGKSAILPTVRV